MSYIVKNCMCAYGFVNEPMYCLWEDEVPIYKTLCQDRTDCVIKRVLEKCKDIASDTGFYAYDFANEILQLFDIEEINK